MTARDVSQGHPRQVLHAVATVVLAFAVMASVSALGLSLLGAGPPGSLAVATVAAASGGAVGLTSTLSGDVFPVRSVGLEGEVSTDAVIKAFGRTIPAVHPGFGGEVFPAIRCGTASGMVAGFAGGALVDLARRVRRAGPYPREGARLRDVGR